MHGTVVDAYKSTATPGTPENETNLAALASALLGISSGSPTKALAGGDAFPQQTIFIASGMQPGTAHLPFDLKITVTSDDHIPTTDQETDKPIEKKGSADRAVGGTDGGGPPQQDQNNANAGKGGNGGNKPQAPPEPKQGQNNANAGNKPQAPAEPTPGVMSCTGTNNSLPCTTTRTFTSKDREWWDVSIGIALPGVRETKYGINNGALHSSVTRHTDFYGMLDLYPFAFAGPKDSAIPHFNVGVPITGQSLYRPYFGMAESLGGFLTGIFRPERQIGLPLGLNVFAGVTWMKTQVVTGNPTTAADLANATKYVRVRKVM